MLSINSIQWSFLRRRLRHYWPLIQTIKKLQNEERGNSIKERKYKSITSLRKRERERERGRETERQREQGNSVKERREDRKRERGNSIQERKGQINQSMKNYFSNSKQLWTKDALKI